MRASRLPASRSLSSASCCDDSSQARLHPKAGTPDRAEFGYATWQTALRRRGRRARQLGARSSFHEQRHIISDPTSIESRVHAGHRRGDLVRRKMRILAGQTCLDFGDGSLLADLGHRDSFQVAGAIVNPWFIVWSCSIHLATHEPACETIPKWWRTPTRLRRGNCCKPCTRTSTRSRTSWRRPNARASARTDAVRAWCDVKRRACAENCMKPTD